MEKLKFKVKFFRRVGKTHPWVALRIVVVFLLLLPLWLLVLMGSLIKSFKWRSQKTCLEFIRGHVLAFPEADLETLEISRLSGGLSNLNLIWKLKNSSGETLEFFVKVFLPLGSLWAAVNSLASPFPQVRAQRIHERFAVDMVSRTQLAERGIAVPKLVAFDPVEKVMVTECLHGIVVDEILRRIEEKGNFSDEDREIISQCAAGLGKVHAEGFSLIDTQPVNCIWVPSVRKVYFIDLEFCTRSDKRVWDLCFFLVFLTARLSENHAREARRIFLEHYQKQRKIDLADLRKTTEELEKYVPVFQTILDMRQFSPQELLNEFLS